MLRNADSEQQNSHSMRISTKNHLVEKVNSNRKSIQKYCSLCYNKIKKVVAKELENKPNKQALTATNVLVNHKCAYPALIHGIKKNFIACW